MKRVRRKGGNKEKVFGCDLMEHLSTTSQEVPHVLRSCSEFIEEHGIVDGIYRLSGVSSNTQKLRSEFDSEGNPDLRKDVYLQDIHCVSSLCKAYFRELPNPLLTYQLYDHFAEAVAVQLEDERLVKIKEVLKELPPPHLRTLEFLMRHLVKMSTYSAETNMHARNLAIVWAPNLLRSKDIEASGFNGTAAFMEVRVQSIVVEFILTHVPQLFPDTAAGVTTGRRQSLPPSPTHEDFYKAIPFQYPGNMSPGDGPPPMKPYHAIIEPSDKRKGSLKGRKWRSIFNLGGRLPDPRKRNKGSTKDKEKQPLRPAKSMDSLSPGPYEGNHPGASPTQLSPVAPMGQEGGASGGVGHITNSYAVTYRRGGGASVSVVSGGGGTQGTYSRLDSAGGASGGSDGTGAGTGLGAGLAPVSRSPGMASRADKRAGIHISGPFSVTVPLHITSGLLGVIQGNRGEEESPTPAEEEGERKRRGKEEEKEERGLKKDGKREEEEQEQREDGASECEGRMGEGREEEGEDQRKAERQRCEVGVEVTPPPVDREGEERSVNGQLSSEEEEEEEEEEVPNEEHKEEEEEEKEEESETGEGDYMEMRSTVHSVPLIAADGTVAASSAEEADVPMFPEEEYSDANLPLDFQDTFGFLDMIDSSISQPNNEFSVEPPCFEDGEYEDQTWFEHNIQTGFSPPQKDQLPSLMHSHTPPSLPTSLPQHTRLPNKSHSLPYKCSPSYPEASSSSDEADLSGLSDEDEEEDGMGVYEDMLIRSLPNNLEFHGLAWSESRDKPLPANSGTDTCLSGQSEDTVQTALCPTSSGHVYTSMEDQSDISNQTDIFLASGGVCVNQSEGSGIHDNVQLPISSQDIEDSGQSQSSPETDTSSIADQFTNILPISQSDCSEVQTDSNHDYVKMRVKDVEGDRVINKEKEQKTHGEEKKEESSEENSETSCKEEQRKERQRVAEEWVPAEMVCLPITEAEGPSQPHQDTCHTTHPDLCPQLPVRGCHGDTEDIMYCHGETESEVEEEDISDPTANLASIASPQGEAGNGVTSERLSVVSCEHREGGGQDRKFKNDGEEGEEMEEKKDGGNVEEMERGHDERDDEREEDVQEEQTKDIKVEADGDREKEPEMRAGGDEGEKKEREEEQHEGSRSPLVEAEEEEEQLVGEERVVTEQTATAEESRDERKIDEEKEERETEGAEHDTTSTSTAEASDISTAEASGISTAEASGISTAEASDISTAEAGAMSRQVGNERKEGHPEETAQDRQQVVEWLLDSQTDPVRGASEGRERAEQLKDDEGRVEERREKREKDVRKGAAEERDREGKMDDKLMVLGPGVGRTLVTSKQVTPRTQQVKSVPVVPPKPQQSRLTALNLRQQLQGRDTQTQHRDDPRTDTLIPDTQTPQQHAQTPKKDTEMTQDIQTPDTEILHSPEARQHLEHVKAGHSETSATHEHTDAELHTDTVQAWALQSDPTPAGHTDTEPHAPNIVTDPQQTHVEMPEQPKHCTAEQLTALGDSEREAGMGGETDSAREQGANNKDRHGEPKDTDQRGEERQSEKRGTGRNGSPDVKKDRLGLREGEREWRPREREVQRNSGISICFDEAVARATREREREREHGERERERERGVNVQDEKARL